MTDVAESITKLREFADELDRLSRALNRVEQDLEPVEKEYQTFVDDFEVGLWTKHEDEGSKLPSEALRLKLAHKKMNPELLGRYVGLVHARKRGEKRIATLKTSVEAQRSILSALKTEAEALR